MSNSFLAVFYLDVFVFLSLSLPTFPLDLTCACGYVSLCICVSPSDSLLLTSSNFSLCVTHIYTHIEFMGNRILCRHISLVGQNQIEKKYIEMTIEENWKEPQKLALHESMKWLRAYLSMRCRRKNVFFCLQFFAIFN